MDVDKLTYEIFSILENNFLFGYEEDPKFSVTKQHQVTPSPAVKNVSAGKIRILSIDAGGSTDGVLAAKSLAHLELTLRRKSGNPNAHIADFFDVVAGAGVGGILAGLLFTRGKDDFCGK
ncbi:Patatin-like protein 6 [Forsythia ovata]|uniref:Patatin-like protein 6 n=1 Tax=Forsythia ovata TaxID=205694 RepID=A0ABD1PM81_9LAMI